MSAAFKTIFKRIGGKIIPIRQSLMGHPDEIQKIMHIQRARAALRNTPSIKIDGKMFGTFFRISRQQSVKAGATIGRRIFKLVK